MTIPDQPKSPVDEILLRVSNDPKIALPQVILDELNRMHRRIIQLETDVAGLKSQISNRV